MITSAVWKKIIKSNHWEVDLPGENGERMIVDPKVLFKMNLGEFVFRCEDERFAKTEGAKESPYVAKLPDEAVLSEVTE